LTVCRLSSAAKTIEVALGDVVGHGQRIDALVQQVAMKPAKRAFGLGQVLGRHPLGVEPGQVLLEDQMQAGAGDRRRRRVRLTARAGDAAAALGLVVEAGLNGAGAGAGVCGHLAEGGGASGALSFEGQDGLERLRRTEYVHGLAPI